MDLREYDYLSKQPDHFPRSTLRSIRQVLDSIGSKVTTYIDTVFLHGYITPPDAYKYHGYYKIVLTNAEKQEVLRELERSVSLIESKTTLLQREDMKQELLTRRQWVKCWNRLMTESPVPWELVKDKNPYFDLREATHSDFQSFIFEHEDREWVYDLDLWVDYEPEYIARLYSELFLNSGDLLKKYAVEQIDRGCWAMLSSGYDGNLEDLIWGDVLEPNSIRTLINSMYGLYANLFDQVSIQYSCDMWWDSLAYDFNPMNNAHERSKNHTAIQEAMHETLVRILRLDSKECQMAALHGLNHVYHPDTEKVINRYMSENTHLSEEDKKFALACSKGEMM